MIFTSRDIQTIRCDMHEWNGTNAVALGSATSYRSLKKLARQQEEADDILNAFFTAAESGRDMSTPEEAYKSVVGFLLPWFLQWLFRSAIKRIVVWLWNRTQSKRVTP